MSLSDFVDVYETVKDVADAGVNKVGATAAVRFSKAKKAAAEAAQTRDKANGLPALDAKNKLVEAKKKVSGGHAKYPLATAQAEVKWISGLFQQQVSKEDRLRRELGEAEAKAAKLATELLHAETIEKEAVRQSHAQKVAGPSPVGKQESSIPLEAILADKCAIGLGA